MVDPVESLIGRLHEVPDFPKCWASSLLSLTESEISVVEATVEAIFRDFFGEILSKYASFRTSTDDCFSSSIRSRFPSR